jgi:hypothetical protein
MNPNAWITITMKSIALLFLVLSCPTLTDGAVDEGFGGLMKMKVSLKRRRPPKVCLTSTDICIRIASQVPRASALVAPMASMLESELIGNDRRLKPDCHKPQTVISCTVTRFDLDEKWETRRIRPLFGKGEVTQRFQIISGTLHVSYQVKDAEKERILDAGNLSASYSQEFLDGKGAPSQNEVGHKMMKAILNQLVPRLVPTLEEIEVLLAKGSLEAASKLGKSGLWGRMLEELERMPPLPKRRDDAYRMYSIGVAYEALAYEAEDLKAARELLNDAAIHYGQALEMNPQEKYFREPQTRIQTAIVQYAELENWLASCIREKETKQFQSPRGGASSQPQQQTVLTNKEIVEFKRKGLDDENLIEMIKAAKVVQFDLSPTGVRYLLDNGITNPVITAMRTRQRQAPSVPRTRRPTRIP